MLGKILKDIFKKNPDLRAGNRPLENGMQIPLPSFARGGGIIVFHAGSEGEAHKSFTDHILDPILPFAMGIRDVDVRNDGWQQQLTAILEDPVWFVFSYFGAGLHININYQGKAANIWEAAGIPFLRAYGDIPAYYPVAHQQAYLNLVNVYGFQEHADFFNRWMNPRLISLVLPPLLHLPCKDSEIDFAAKSNGAIIFPKNGNDPDALLDYWQASLPPYISLALKSVSEELTSRAVIDLPVKIDDALMSYFRRLSVDLDGHRRIFYFMVAQLDDYLRRVKSTMIVKALLDYPIEVRGTKWDHVSFAGKKAKQVRDPSVVNTQKLIKTSLAIIDMSPNTHYQPHDRILRAASQHTLALTNIQTIFMRNFENYRQFSFEYSPQSIEESVSRVLDDRAAAIELGREQARKIYEFVTEGNYAKTVLTAVDACTLGLGERPEGTQDFVQSPR